MKSGTVPYAVAQSDFGFGGENAIVFSIFSMFSASGGFAFGPPSPDISLPPKRLKVKGLNIYIPPLTLNDQQRFTVRSGILTGNDIRWRSASSGNPLPE